MDFPAEGVEISVLADIVTQRLHIPILYDDTIKNKRVIIRVPIKVPESALMGILQSALRMKEMALVDAEQPGWKQIVIAPNLAAVAKPGPQTGEAEGAIAQVFVLQHADPTHIAEAIKPFLTQPNGYTQVDALRKVLIISDYANVLHRVAELIRRLDVDSPPAEIRFVPLKQAEASILAPAVTQILTSRETSHASGGAPSGIVVTADDRSNQLVVAAPAERLKEVLDLIEGLDKAPSLTTKVYRFKSVSADRVDHLMRGLLEPSLLKRAYQSVVDRESESLAVSATPEVHARLDELVKQLDVQTAEGQSPIHFYKLRNTKASDVLSTISSLLGQDESDKSKGEENGESTGAAGPAGGAGGNMSSGAQSSGQASPSSPRSAANSAGGLSSGFGSSGLGTSSAGGISGGGMQSSGGSTGSSSDVRYVSPALGGGTSSGGAQAPASVKAKNATVAADVNTNTIIVIAPPRVQDTYAELIKRLDERRPQVQIECTIVTLDTSNGFAFGVDIGRLGGFGTSQVLTLSSFGVSTPNATTGQLVPGASTGGTFALLSPRIANIVVNALATNSRSRFLSAPQLLVNDNGKGKLESVAQEPFAVILDASTTQSLTSLGGMAQAGTSITVEPHISEADYLQLSYSIELSNFTGSAANGLPPPSEKNSVDSSVTIPDGYTIVVGGLTTKSFNTAVNTIPILGDIPFLKYLFGTRSNNLNDTTLFVFIKPVILRDDKFEDLKFLSTRSSTQAGLPSDYPQGEPIPMK